MSDIATVRRKIGDRTKSQTDVIEGNGIDRSVSLQHGNVWGVIIRINEAELTPEQYEVESQSGRIIFTAAPIEGSSVSMSYFYAAYTDAEIEELVASEGGITGAVIACLEELTMETARFYDFTQGETSEKRSQVFNNLMKLLESYKTEKANDDAVTRRGSGLRIGKRTVGRERQSPYYPDITQTPSRRI